jgi:gas vesicle protein
MGDKTCSGDFVAGFVVGALVGAAAALLLAPQSGEETRIYIRDKGIELGERADALSVEARRRAEELQAQAKERADTLSAQAKERAGGLQGKVREAVEEGKAAAAKKKEELLSQLGQEQETAAPAE